MIGLQFPEQMTGALQVVQDELDQILARLTGLWRKEHGPDGAHTDVTADSVTADEVTTPSLVGPVVVSGGSVSLDYPLIATPTAIINPAQITATQNNYNPSGWASAVVVRLSSDATRSITGFAAPEDGDGVFRLLVNSGGQTITLEHSDAGSDADNRILGPGSVDVSLTQNMCKWIWYDESSGNWRVVG